MLLSDRKVKILFAREIVDKMSNNTAKNNVTECLALDDIVQVMKSLKDAFKDERAAIESMDQEKLRQISDTISALFTCLSSMMLSLEKYSHEKVQKAASLLREARLLRDENSRLLDKKFYSTGCAVKEGRLHLRAIKAYHREDKRSELFLKKNC
jgi:hypothetical protein